MRSGHTPESLHHEALPHSVHTLTEHVETPLRFQGTAGSSSWQTEFLWEHRLDSCRGCLALRMDRHIVPNFAGLLMLGVIVLEAKQL